jgi:hypothetical protein
MLIIYVTCGMLGRMIGQDILDAVFVGVLVVGTYLAIGTETPPPQISR